MPLATCVPVEQSLPPTRTENDPFSDACQVSVDVPPEPIVVGEVLSIVTVGAAVS